MSTFDLLDPLVQHHIINSLGWRSLRPLQERSIPPVLAGKHCLLLAPTAGGKTEAAIFPVLSRLISQRWTGLSVLYLCPLKALLNNLSERLGSYAALMGRRCEVWHGDVSGSRKGQIRREPPDILLTTPESLEGMLVSANAAGREMLTELRVVVIDEIHAFAADDRGWHLLALLERVTKLAGRELQRVGLSATVGNPDALLEWLSGHCEGEREVVADPQTTTQPPEITLDYVGSLANAALVISRLHRGEKRLVFCDSRSRVEELAAGLRELGVDTYLSHSSLSIEERRSAELAFSQSRNCVIVSTSTLELGIDVGDLDRVIQIDSPNTVASFLQRLGRSGRRSGTTRNCLFLATSERALLQCAALISLWKSGYVEPRLPPPMPLHIFAQQIMALALQLGAIGQADWRSWIGRLPAFDLTEAESAAIFDHLVEVRILHRDSGMLSFGEEGESLFGRRHFLEMLAVFSTPSMMTVFHGLKELGQVETGALSGVERKALPRLALGGESWVIVNIDWKGRRISVEPSGDKGRGAWIGSGQALSPVLARAMKATLTDSAVAPEWSKRATTAMKHQRSHFDFLRAEGHTLLVEAERSRSEWYNFAGRHANEAISQRLEFRGVDCSPSELSIRLRTTAATPLIELLAELDAPRTRAEAKFSAEVVGLLKFNECLPKSVVLEILRVRLISIDIIAEVLRQPTMTVFQIGK